MNQTETCGLSQWEKPDRILMEDFNADNAKMEAALAAQAESQSALAAQMANCGNCKITHQTYTGAGKYGSANPCSLTFETAPDLIIIVGKGGHTLFLHSGSVNAYGNGGTSIVSWNGSTVSWYSNGSVAYQFNESGSTYQVFAFLLIQ